MSDIEAEQCLEQHRAQQDKLTRKLNTEKEKQEKVCQYHVFSLQCTLYSDYKNESLIFSSCCSFFIRSIWQFDPAILISNKLTTQKNPLSCRIQQYVSRVLYVVG